MAHIYHMSLTPIIIYLKCYNQMRNQVGDDWLNNCLVIYIKKNIFIDIKNAKIIQNFHNMKNHR